MGANYGVQNGNGTKLLYWLLGGMMALNVTLTAAFISWAGSAIVQMQADVAVIKCQLSPQCTQVAVNGNQTNRP